MSPTLARARALLHQRTGLLAPVREVADAVGLNPDSLTRAFTAAWGLSPKQYCHRARLFDAVIRLLVGASIVDAALDAGFNDLGRFYSQFKRLVHATPGTYANVGKREDRL